MSMKRGFPFLALFLLLCGGAFAAVQDFPKFKIDVPSDWTSSQAGPTVILIANDKTASISITVAPTEGAPLAELAKAFVNELKGTDLAPESGGFSFTFKSGEAASRALLMENPDTKEYVLIAITGENPKVSQILGSLQDK